MLLPGLPLASRYKLLPIKNPELNFWNLAPVFPKKDIEDFILKTNSIPFIPSFQFSRIEKGFTPLGTRLFDELGNWRKDTNGFIWYDVRYNAKKMVKT